MRGLFGKKDSKVIQPLNGYNKGGRSVVKKEKYYKNKYLIALYDSDDFPFLVVSNVKELAESTGKNYNILQSSLSHQKNAICVNGKKYKVYLIPVDEEEEDL